MCYFVKLAQTEAIYLQMAAGEQGLGGMQITLTMILTAPGHPLSTPLAARSFAFAIGSTHIIQMLYMHAISFSMCAIWMHSVGSACCYDLLFRGKQAQRLGVPFSCFTLCLCNGKAF